MSRAKKEVVSATIVRPDGTKIEVRATPDVIADIASKCGGIWPTYTVSCSLHGFCMFHGTYHPTIVWWPSVCHGGAQTMGGISYGAASHDAQAESASSQGLYQQSNALMGRHTN